MQKNETADKVDTDIQNALQLKLKAVTEHHSEEPQILTDEMMQFISLVADKYKATLHSVYTAMEFVIKNDARNLSDSSRANLRRVQAEVQRTRLLTDDISTYAEICYNELNLAETDLNEVLQTAIHSVPGGSENLLQIHNEKLPVIYADPLLLLILVKQIINNTVKFKQKTIAPVIRVTYSRDIWNAGNEPKEYHVICFKDNSMGFANEEAENVFHPFYKTDALRYPGSGMGLCMVKKIMEKHKGFVQAFSEETKGTVIQLRFPV